MITMNEALRLIEERREDVAVVPTMTAGRGWRKVSRSESLDLPVGGAMGKASSMALGLCLAQPDKKVIVVDGDWGLLMNLVTIGGTSPENLFHFVAGNGVYAVTGGQSTPNFGGIRFAGIARSAGYARAFEIDDLKEFASSVDEVMDDKEPVLVSIKTEPEIENTPIWERSRGAARRTPEAIKELMRALAW